MKKAIVLLSGGLDSATVLAIAKSQGFDCYCLSFNYGQRSVSELNAAKKISDVFSTNTHKIVDIDLSSFAGSALTDLTIDIPECETEGIPVTYVPARNTIFLSLALAYAEVLDSSDIFIGVNAIDYSGYPDCRPEYIDAFSKMANLATKKSVEGDKLIIHTPLINLSKKQIIQQGIDLGVDYNLTVSCYDADADGLACGICDSCRIRHEGFIDLGLSDQTLYKENKV